MAGSLPAWRVLAVAEGLGPAAQVPADRVREGRELARPRREDPVEVLVQREPGGQARAVPALPDPARGRAQGVPAVARATS